MKKPVSRARPLDDPGALSLAERVAKEARLAPLRAVNPHDDTLRWGGEPVGHGRWAAEGGLALCRIGPLFFLDEAAGRRLGAGLKEELGANAIWVRDLKGGMLGGPLGDYTMVAVAALLRADLAGRHVVDAGAAEGLLSLAAARLGAASFELVEQDRAALAAARANFSLNGLSERSDFRLVEADLSEPAAVAKLLRPGSAPAALLSNLGYWEYSATNAEGILLLDLLPHGALFLGAGYSSACWGGLRHLAADVELLGALGYRPAPEMASLTRDDWRSLRGREDVRAFLAVRDGSPRLGPEELSRHLAARRGSWPARVHALGRRALPWLFLGLAILLAALLYVMLQAARRAV